MDTPIPTPETDKAAGSLTGVNLCAAFETKCRQLEIERNEARKIAAELRDLVFWSESEPWNFSWENS